MNIVKNGALFLLIILITGLVLFSVLGGTYVKEGYTNAATSWADKVMLASGVTNSKDSSGNSTDSDDDTDSSGNKWGYGSTTYDNYDHYSKTSSPTVYYGPHGSTANVMNSDGTFSIVVKNSNGTTTVYKTNTPISQDSLTKTLNSTGMSADSISSLMKLFSNSTFYGPNGGSARFFTGNKGQYAIEVTKSTGDTILYTSSNTYTYNYDGTTEKSYNGYSNSKSNPNSSTHYVNTKSDKTFQSANKKGQYDSTMPSGITKSMIPDGQEDLYILKSEVVPPVCPVCPACNLQSKTSSDSKGEKCPPCPACARCPEPSFECKKVPNYKSHGSNYESGQNKNSYDDGYNSQDEKQEHHRHQQNSTYTDYDSRPRNNNSSRNYDIMGNYNPSGNPGYLPVPVLSDFSTFGM